VQNVICPGLAGMTAISQTSVQYAWHSIGRTSHERNGEDISLKAGSTYEGRVDFFVSIVFFVSRLFRLFLPAFQMFVWW
jgi:hypothetical protein